MGKEALSGGKVGGLWEVMMRESGLLQLKSKVGLLYN